MGLDRSQWGHDSGTGSDAVSVAHGPGTGYRNWDKGRDADRIVPRGEAIRAGYEGGEKGAHGGSLRSRAHNLPILDGAQDHA